MKAKRLVYHSFIDAARRHQSSGSEKNDFITHSTVGSISFMFILLLLACPPSPPGRYRETQINAAHSASLSHLWGSLGLGSAYSLKEDINNLPNIRSEGRHYYTGQVTNLFSAPKTMFLPSKAVWFTNILNKIVEKRLPILLVWKMCSNAKTTK